MKRSFVCVLDSLEPSIDCFLQSKRQVSISESDSCFGRANDGETVHPILAIFEKLLGDYEGLRRLGDSTEVFDIELQKLSQQCQYYGLAGQQGVDAIHLSEMKIITLEGTQFVFLYDFAFFICRETGRKHLQVDRACELWNVLLQNRFRLLPKWIAFVNDSNLKVITKDVWREVLDFSRTVFEDLSNYDLNGAWPVILDEFVLHLKQQQIRESTLPDQLLSLSLTPIPGNKRRLASTEGMLIEEEHGISHESKQMKSKETMDWSPLCPV